MKIIECKNKRHKKDVLDALAEEAKFIYEARDKEILELLENDVQKIIYLDWRSGGHVGSPSNPVPRYRLVSKYDYGKAHSAIMETICLGLG